MGGTKAAPCAADLIYNWSATIKAKSKRKALYCILSEQTYQDEHEVEKRWQEQEPSNTIQSGCELDVADDTRGRSMAAGRRGVCGDHMESCHLTIWIYTTVSSYVPTNKHGKNSLSEAPSWDMQNITVIIRWLVRPTLSVTEQMRADQCAALQMNGANFEVTAPSLRTHTHTCTHRGRTQR